MDGLVADLDAPIGQKIFDIAKAQAKMIVKPNRVTDDVGMLVV